MKKNNNPILYMQNHYFHRQDFSTLQEMLYFVGNEYSDKPAFILKDNSGYPYTVSYFNFVKDVEAIGISLINQGFANTKIAVIGHNSYKWAISYLAASIVGIVVPIDKLSILVSIAFSYIVFKEKLTKKAFLGLVIIVIGTLVLLIK